MIAYSLTSKSITIVVNYVPRTIPSTHANFAEIVRLAKDAKTTEAQITPLLDVGKTIETASNGNIQYKNGKLFFKGFEVKSTLATTIIAMLRDGNEAGAKPLQAFLEKAFNNPDPRAATDLFDWVVNSGLPITPQGDILAWKAVRMDYLSIHGGGRRGDRVFDHHVGNTVEEDRSYCDADPARTCSRGLHFASAEYMKHYAGGGSRIVAVAVSPTDVVAFPRDYGWQKGRAAKYVVVGEVPFDAVPEFYPQGKRVYDWKKAAAPTAPSAVGQVWLTRDGREVTVVRTNVTTTKPYTVQTDNGVYTASGRFVSDTEENPNDLVKFVR